MPVDTVHFSMCNKLMRRSLLAENSIAPVSGIDCWDDLTVTAPAMALAGRRVVVDRPLYNYTVDPGHRSLSRSHRDIVLRQRLASSLLLEKWFDARGLADRYARFLLLMKFNAKIKYLQGSDCNVAKWRETYPEVNAALLSMNVLPLWQRLAFKLIDILPDRPAAMLCRLATKARG